MKLLDILKKVGGGIIKTVIPGSGIIDTINAILPSDKKLPSTATGTDVEKAIADLPPESRAEVLSKQFDVEITEIKESYGALNTMLENDAKNPQSTRPKIAYQSFQVMAATNLIVICIWAYAVIAENELMVQAIMTGWPFVAGINGVLATVLLAYFGSLNKEHKNKTSLAGAPPPPSALSGIMSIFKK